MYGISLYTRLSIPKGFESHTSKFFALSDYTMKSQYSDLPEPVSHSDLPETTAQHITHDLDGLQLDQAEKIPWHTAYENSSHDEKQVAESQRAEVVEKSKSRRCGLAPWLFWSLICGGIAVVIIAAVAGGVVGSKDDSSDSKVFTAPTAGGALQGSTQSTTTASSLHTKATSASPSSTTQIFHAGDRTLYRDCPSSNDTVYTYGGASSPMLFRKWCGMACWNTQGVTAMVNEDTDSLDSCINLCASYNLVLDQTGLISNRSSAGRSVCSAVCWRWNPQDPDWPGHCFGYASLNVSGHFNVSEASNCDSAGWMNP